MLYLSHFISDLPLILSAKKVMMLDPQETFFRKYAKKWRLKTHKDEFQPLFDSSLEKVLQCGDSLQQTPPSFNGTLFRFPLRNTPSQLSQTLYTESKVLGLLDSLQADAEKILMFLKYVECLEVYVRESGQQEPCLRFRVQISSDSVLDVRKRREEFVEKIKVAQPSDPPLSCSYPLTIDSESIDMNSGASTTHSSSWLVMNRFASGATHQDLDSFLRDNPGYLPLVGVAMADPAQQLQLGGMPVSQGHVFCCLPLPQHRKSLSGLPVHVNGYFSLDQSRDHIKWPSEDQTEEQIRGDKNLWWNRCLQEQVLPTAYADLVLVACDRWSSLEQRAAPSAIYHSLPDVAKVDENWETSIRIFYQQLFQMNFLFTASGPVPRWISLNEAFFDSLGADDPSTAVILDILHNHNIPVVSSVPDHLQRAICKLSGLNLKEVSPSLVRDCLRENKHYRTLPHESKLQLLNYILRERIRSCQELDGIELLPLTDGTFTEFTSAKRGWSEKVYVTSSEFPASLFPGLENLMLDMTLDDSLMRRLMDLSQSGK